ncbi:MAG: 2'-5' RNA ligase family protein [Bacteroidota bacterium]|nr:hypothetical protein [Candidatus Kapabacteria bacterium]MCS7302774.1 hypothetical protein [Candidatus Kapabacteria bacterium]MCX7936996.1 hypothetical protein [Chlorobiota bacterium]MDW8075467.1 2'-5' RNA ligase family protein [Bacteroidota bacterium]MDW8272324.1 2'-5' RNA ligase family protein [Bacteroidota bacterium]
MQPNWFVALRATVEPPVEYPPLKDGMRLLHPEDLHITVSFFGSLREDPTERLRDILPAMHCPPSTALATTVHLLPRKEFASVVALGFGEESDHLRAYIAQWRNQLRTLVGLPPEQRPILPHLTIVRMKPTRDRRLIAERQQWMQALAERLPFSVHISGVGLFTWQERFLQHQPRYRTTLHIPFD